ncbi:MAG: hypothetical protein IH617_12860, partial [Hydrogenophaga sp.]|nr:hypothetical protein [Hydrogenophaga sp.]
DDSENLLDLLRDLERQGRISGDAVREALADALRGEDLAAFEVRARAAFAGVADSAGLMEVALDAKLREAIRRSGADFAVLAGGMSAASRSAINDTDAIIDGMGRLKAQGVDVGKTLEASLGNAIRTADSQAAVDALVGKIQGLRSTLGAKVTDGLLDQLRKQADQAGLALDKIPAKAESVAERTRKAFEKMGIQTKGELQKTVFELARDYELIKNSGQATAEDLAKAWRRWAEASIAANGGVASETMRAEARMHGLEIATDRAGKAIVQSMKDAADSIDGASAAAQRYIGWADRMAERNKRVGSDAAAEEERKRLGVDKDGFTLDKSGNRLAMGGDLTTLTGIAAFLKSAGIDDDATARRIATEFSDGKGNIPYFSNPGQKRYGGDTISVALLRAAERITFAGAGVGGSDVPGIGTSIPKQQAREVNFNLRVNGRETGTVPTTEEGAQALIKTLQDAQRSAGS